MDRQSLRGISVLRMQQIDTAAIDTFKIPRLLLMEHAGMAVARAVAQRSAAITLPVVICCGMGFNGGDGLAAARHLHAWGYPLSLVLLGRIEALRDEPSIYATILQRLGLPIIELTAPPSAGGDRFEEQLSACGLVIDAMLGIGARGSIREPMASVITRINAARAPVIAVDIPSGLDADTGRVASVAIRATRTVTFGLPKRGCVLEEGPACVGVLDVDAITIPPRLLADTSDA